mmetsp:Transcript_26166/g.80488  ORF Transcript_26166/g.80488 Transcript_26166/m.80488 type:complete len:258 (-) Transcript_26166:215-988(-)
MAASHCARSVVGKWIKPMPRCNVEAMKPHTLATAPPPSERRTECLSMPTDSTWSANCEKTSNVLASSPSGTTILWTGPKPSFRNPAAKFSPYSPFTVSSVKIKRGLDADVLGMISNVASSGAKTTPRATSTSVLTAPPVVKVNAADGATEPFFLSKSTFSRWALSTRDVRAWARFAMSPRSASRDCLCVSDSLESSVAYAARRASRSRVVRCSSSTRFFASSNACVVCFSSAYNFASGWMSPISPLAPVNAPSRYCA